jgi:hypothetical protein
MYFTVNPDSDEMIFGFHDRIAFIEALQDAGITVVQERGGDITISSPQIIEEQNVIREKVFFTQLVKNIVAEVKRGNKKILLYQHEYWGKKCIYSYNNCIVNNISSYNPSHELLIQLFAQANWKVRVEDIETRPYKYMKWIRRVSTYMIFT